MKHLLDLVIRMGACLLLIHAINYVLVSQQMEVLVGINWATLLVSGILGFPGILGIYIIYYLIL